MTASFLALFAAAVLLLPQLARVFGAAKGVAAGCAALGALGGAWWLLGAASPYDSAPADWSKVASVSSESCARCHPDHHESWRRTYHRTMTREATPETVKGDFDSATHDYQGFTTRLTRRGDAFHMETLDPRWAAAHARLGDGHPSLPPPQYARFKVDRLVGSHWIQECLHREPSGRYLRLPVLYHIVEQKWVHTNGAFLAPDTPDFWSKSRDATWNNTCLYCHNTEPAKNPVVDPRGRVVGYKTEASELGISCAACHGPGGDHVAANANPARRFALQESGDADSTIVHPERLGVARRDEICARCHGALVPKPERWNLRTHRDPFVPGMELTAFNALFWSEAEQAALAEGKHSKPSRPEPTDGRFWGDGTPLTTALEYNGMALSKCYQNGRGSMSCLSCHSMHADDPNFLLKPGTGGDEACLQCHGEYRGREAEHSRHPAGSAGARCVSCHMPPVVYSLLATHRSHRIEVPHVADSLDTGKPNACVLCHLDRPLGWVNDQLARRSSTPKPLPRPLTAQEESRSASLLMLATDDARTRVVVAGAFCDPAAQKASGTDWFGPALVRVLEADRYPAVRTLAARALRRVHGDGIAYDPLARPADRDRQTRALKARFGECRILGDAAWADLLKRRNDPDVTINE